MNNVILKESKYMCPLCKSFIDYKTRFTIPKRFRLYGRNVKEILKIIKFAQEKGYVEANKNFSHSEHSLEKKILNIIKIYQFNDHLTQYGIKKVASYVPSGNYKDLANAIEKFIIIGK